MSDNKPNMILAEKKIGSKIYRKKFTEQAWNIMGKDKNGWKELPAEAQDKKPITPVKPQAKKVASVSSDAPAEAKETPVAKTAAQLRKELEEAEKREAEEKKAEEAKEEATEEKVAEEPAEEKADEPAANEEQALSKDTTATKAIAIIKSLKTKAEIESYTEGDDRSTVQKARDKFIAELK